MVFNFITFYMVSHYVKELWKTFEGLAFTLENNLTPRFLLFSFFCAMNIQKDVECFSAWSFEPCKTASAVLSDVMFESSYFLFECHLFESQKPLNHNWFIINHFALPLTKFLRIFHGLCTTFHYIPFMMQLINLKLMQQITHIQYWSFGLCFNAMWKKSL